jgi:RimJ/RimL family protein N-acetyltransferase
MDQPTIETDRLTLRPFTDEDTERYWEILTTPEVSAALYVSDGFTREQAWGQMTSWRGQFAMRGTGQWAVEEKATGRMIGRAGTHRPERPDWPGVEIGWVLDPDRWGNGFATEAGRASVQWAFAHHDVGEVFSVILPENTPSAAVARRLGFTVIETRIVSHFPRAPHDIWQLARP